MGVATMKISCRSSRTSHGASVCQSASRPLSSRTARIMSSNAMGKPVLFLFRFYLCITNDECTVLLRQRGWPFRPIAPGLAVLVVHLHHRLQFRAPVCQPGLYRFRDLCRPGPGHGILLDRKSVV